MVKIRFGAAVLIFICAVVFSNFSASAQSDPVAPSAQIKPGAVTGKIMIEGGGPLAGGRVFFYDTTTGPPPFKDKFRRLPDMSGEIDADGRFTVELPAGKYYMRAGKKMSDEGTGLQEGDYVFFSLDENGKPKEYSIRSGEFLDVGTISGAAPYKKVEQIVKTAIEGTITDMEGKPVEGATVFAFLDQTTTKRPLFASRKTGGDGKYILRVQEGTYYLRVRNKLGGGPPEPGQIVGIFGEQVPTAITVKDGEIRKGIDIKVIRFRGRGPAAGMGPKRQ
jgi:hypothetical protein